MVWVAAYNRNTDPVIVLTACRTRCSENEKDKNSDGWNAFETCHFNPPLSCSAALLLATGAACMPVSLSSSISKRISPSSCLQRTGPLLSQALFDPHYFILSYRTIPYSALRNTSCQCMSAAAFYSAVTQTIAVFCSVLICLMQLSSSRRHFSLLLFSSFCFCFFSERSWFSASSDR